MYIKDIKYFITIKSRSIIPYFHCFQHLWIPGGQTSGGKTEAVLDNVVITHNKSISNLPNAKPILEY